MSEISWQDIWKIEKHWQLQWQQRHQKFTEKVWEWQIYLEGNKLHCNGLYVYNYRKVQNESMWKLYVGVWAIIYFVFTSNIWESKYWWRFSPNLLSQSLTLEQIRLREQYGSCCLNVRERNGDEEKTSKSVASTLKWLPVFYRIWICCIKSSITIEK